MVGTCANPTCSAQFHNVHRGKLFLLETREQPSGAEPHMFIPVRHHPSVLLAFEHQDVRLVLSHGPYGHRQGLVIG